MTLDISRAVDHQVSADSPVHIDTLQQVTPEVLTELSVLMNCLKTPGTPVAPLSEAWVSKIVYGTERDIVVARDRNERIIGSMTLTQVMEPMQEGSYTHIGGVVVHPEARGQQLTERMLAFTEWWSQVNGISKLRLFTEPDARPAAAKVYTKLGFVKEETSSSGDLRAFYVKTI